MELVSALDSFSLFFKSPSQRLYWPFLLSSLLIILLYSKKDFFKTLNHPSTFFDLKISLLNGLLKLFIFPFFLISSYSVSVEITKLLYSTFPSFSGIELKETSLKFFLTFLCFVVQDFLRFFQHYLMHKLPLFKFLHQTHHSARVLTPITLLRTHPLEALISGCRGSIGIGIGIGLSTFLAQKPIQFIDIIGVNLFGIIFNAFFANLRHSSVPMSFGFLEYFFISPRMHQIHHSSNPIHFNKNFGVALAIWDQCFGSFYRPSKAEAKGLKFGTLRSRHEKSYKPSSLLLIPKIFKSRAFE